MLLTVKFTEMHVKIFTSGRKSSFLKTVVRRVNQFEIIYVKLIIHITDKFPNLRVTKKHRSIDGPFQNIVLFWLGASL